MQLTTKLHMRNEGIKEREISLRHKSPGSHMDLLASQPVLRPYVFCAAVLGFTEVMADSSNLGHFTLGLHDMGRYMRLDAAAQRALNVMKSRSDANDAFSLYGLMNRCKTVMGRRLLKVMHVDCCRLKSLHQNGSYCDS